MKGKNLLVIVLLFCASLLSAQDVKVVKDFRIRTSLGIEKNFFEKFSIYSEFNLEFEKDASQLGRIFGEAGVYYFPLKFLSVGANYRYIKNRKRLFNEYNTNYRFAINTEAKYKIDRLKLAYRIQYQRSDDDFSMYDSDEPGCNIFRNRLKMSYNLPGTRLKPYISGELYVVGENNIVSIPQIKTIFGFEYSLKKFGELDLYFRIDKEIGSLVPYTYDILGFSYYYKF